MGILDDAIRQHLELKRQHGAPEEELQRQEEEALGPARRDVASAEVTDEERDAELEAGEAAEETEAAESAAPDAEETPAADTAPAAEAAPEPHEQETMLQEPEPPPEPPQT